MAIIVVWPAMPTTLCGLMPTTPSLTARVASASVATSGHSAMRIDEVERTLVSADRVTMRYTSARSVMGV